MAESLALSSMSFTRIWSEDGFVMMRDPGVDANYGLYIALDSVGDRLCNGVTYALWEKPAANRHAAFWHNSL